MKKALLLFPHGLGDLIMATPCLRKLYSMGFLTDVIVRTHVIDSHLMDACPYIGHLYRTKADGSPAAFSKIHIPLFNELKEKAKYDWTGFARAQGRTFPRIKKIAEELELTPDTWDLEVFVTREAKRTARQFYCDLEVLRFVFVHTAVPRQPAHSWSSAEFVKKMFPSMLIVDTRWLRKWDDINITFALMAMASHRVISSSVMVHACDAMNCSIDVVNYGFQNKTCEPIKEGVMLRKYIKGRRQVI